MKNIYIPEYLKITCQRAKFVKTETGKSWKKQPVSVTIETVSNEFYNNFVNSVSFFNNFGFGSSCRSYNDYTLAGYIPVRITTISPYQETKEITTFQISYK